MIKTRPQKTNNAMIKTRQQKTNNVMIMMNYQTFWRGKAVLLTKLRWKIIVVGYSNVR